MKVCYNTHASNANKHPLLPSSYPWTEYHVADDFICPEGFSELEESAFETMKAAIDISAYNAAVLESAALQQQRAQRQFGEQLAEILIDEMGEELILLEASGGTIDVSVIMGAIQPIIELLQFGLLKSARTALSALLPAMSAYEAYINAGVNQITAFLTANGWDS